MKTIRFTILLMLGLLLLPFFAKAESDGGSSSNGGGAGLIRTYNGITEVITVDRWETQYRLPLEGMYVNESPVEYLRRILDTNVRPLEPYFVLRLEEALSQVLSSTWTDVPNLPLLDDTGRIKGEGRFKRQLWKPVQLIVRSSDSVRGHRPKVTIRFNKDLFNRLDKFDQALLLLHEAVYVLGSELQQKDSYNVRKLVTFLLAKEITKIIDKNGKLTSHRELSHEFRDELRDLGFGSFAHLFKDELKAALKNNSANRKQIAYSTYLKKNPFPVLTKFWDAPLWMNDEEAFMLYWYLYGGPGEDWNKGIANIKFSLEEYVASPNDELEQVRRVCEMINDSNSPKLGPLDNSKAARHCTKLLN